MVDKSNKVINALKETGFFKPKKMYDGGKVITGIIILLALVAFPFLYNIVSYNVGKASKVPEPKVDTPEIQRLPEKERVCVEPKEYMRDNHMKLLNDWRDWVVREGSRD